MERTVRLIFLAVFVALGIYRFIRSMKAAVSKRPLSGIPGTGGIIAQEARPAAAVNPAPIDPTAPTGSGSIAGPGGPSGGNAAIARFAAAAVFVAGNAVIWLCLFGLAALETVPVIWRLFGGILANFYLIGLARAVGVRLRRGARPELTGGNPFPDS